MGKSKADTSSDNEIVDNNNIDVKGRTHRVQSIPDYPTLNGGVHRRSRRTNSVDRVAEHQQKEKKERDEQPDRPCHSPQDSLLSSTSGYTNYRGVLNLIIILLVLSNGRVALENILKYGILVNPTPWFNVVFDPTLLPSIQIVAGLGAFVLISFWTEKYLLSTGIVNELFGRFFVAVNVAAVIVVPAWIVYTKDCHVVGSSFALFMASVVFLKLVSYHMVNFWCRRDSPRRYPIQSLSKKVQKLQKLRHLQRSISGSEATLRTLMKTKSASSSDNEESESNVVAYPDNLTIRDVTYFILVPTLCYELNFPRSQRIRKRFLFRRFLEMVFLCQVMLGLVQQWILPTVLNSIGPLTDMNLPKLAERLLKLSIPNHIIWLIGFYWLFHSSLNFWAECLRFADREFYRDWWNACSVQYFWANWNIPVHKWCLRHLYKPLLSYGVTRFQASVCVFLVSAFFHEYLVSVPLKMFRIWAFMGMLVQIPFGMFVSNFANHPQWANTLVWLSIILGQPLCILTYYHDYFVATLAAASPET